MSKTYAYNGEKFEVDDSEGCYLKVTYTDIVGYVGVYLQGTASNPYGWALAQYGWRRTKDGLQDASAVSNEQRGLDRLCDALIREYRERQAKAEFKPEEACQQLHDFYKKL